MQANLGPYIVDVNIEYKNNKNLYIRIKEDLKMYVTCSKYTIINEIIKVIKNNEKALIKMYERQLSKKDKDNYHYYLGDKYIVVYDDNIKSPKIDNNMIIVKNEAMLSKFYKNACSEVFSSRMNRLLSMFNNIPPFKLKIRKMTTRWGVNNLTSKTITLNSELIKYDVSLIDYVCIHELCHFYEQNHSSAFWKEVAKRYPYYKEARKRLREE